MALTRAETKRRNKSHFVQSHEIVSYKRTVKRGLRIVQKSDCGITYAISIPLEPDEIPAPIFEAEYRTTHKLLCEIGARYYMRLPINWGKRQVKVFCAQVGRITGIINICHKKDKHYLGHNQFYFVRLTKKQVANIRAMKWQWGAFVFDKLPS